MGRLRAWIGACVLAALCAEAGEDATLALGVVPAPKQVTLKEGEFELDDFAAVLVSEEAAFGTRAAARAVQLGIRYRWGLDLPILRIGDERRLGPRKSIWIVEPRTIRPPDETRKGGEAEKPSPRPPRRVPAADELTAPFRARKPGEPAVHMPAMTIGVKDLRFSKEMVIEGYFIRVDAFAVVIHGASDAGSYWGAQTLLQLIRPPRRGTAFRRARGPTIPCLWMADWPSNPERVVPPELKVPDDPQAAEDFLKLAARYKLNGIAQGAVPANEEVRERLRHVAQYHPVPCIAEPAPVPGAAPLLALAKEAAGEGSLPLALAALGEAAWGPTDPEPAALRQRFAPQAGKEPPAK
ncbi:MAG: hypothetical protein FJ291_09870 [Planctomycetes bacterium]|nr:hypothetical protein [Planctomycetota bacterium]